MQVIAATNYKIKLKHTLTMNKSAPSTTLSRYQKFVIAILAILQFTVILDFMVLSPLGEQLMAELKISPAQFSYVVAGYAISAGISGLLAAGFADRFDRKKILLFFYAGFILGTFLCGIAPGYHFLLGARIITGIFGGVISSVSFAIITDLFALEVRGRVMGFVQMAFAASQVLGIPIGLYMANHLGWHSPFLMIVGLTLPVGLGIIMYLRPIDAHLKIQSDHSAFQHLINTLSQIKYLKAFAATTLLATGGYMLMPFGSDFCVNNLGLMRSQLFTVYVITGAFSMISGPIVGRYSDTIGKYNMFVIGTIISIVLVLFYCNLGITPLWLVIVLNVILFIGIFSRMIPSQALMTAIPEPKDRGAFMGVNSSVQQISGGIASIFAGLIVVRTESGALKNYDILGYVVAGAMIVTVIMMYYINKQVMSSQLAKSKTVNVPTQAVQ
jgi:predicted MFS family arabinose efflux permease